MSAHINQPHGVESIRERIDREDHEQAAQRIESVSPEGRPAHPRMRSAQLVTLMVLMAVVIIAAGVIVAMTDSIAAGLAVLGLGLGLGVLLNPEIWATGFRVAERQELRKEEEAGIRPPSP